MDAISPSMIPSSIVARTPPPPAPPALPAPSYSKCKLRLPETPVVPHLASPFRRLQWRNPTITCKAAGITEISDSEFSSLVLESDRPVLVEFVAPWCGPCRLITPAMSWIAQEYSDRLTVVKIDHDTNPQLIEEYKVYGLPALILFRDGKEVPGSRREGAITKAKLKEYVDNLLDSISVS